MGPAQFSGRTRRSCRRLNDNLGTAVDVWFVSVRTYHVVDVTVEQKQRLRVINTW